MANPWKSLEGISPPVALPMVWRRWLGSDFEPFQRAFLQKRQDIAESFPCPYNCGCWHRLPLRITQPPPDTKLLIPAACQCNPPHCPELRLTLEDVTPWELNWPSLASALRKAFGLNPKIAALGLSGTAQIGSWSADAVPVILTIQIDPKIFRLVVAELAARLKTFILLAPTSQHMDANCQELLTHAQAAFFALDTNVRLTDHGKLQTIKAPGELFAKFTPEPQGTVGEGVARQTFALVKAFQDKSTTRKASLLTVFRFYCVDSLSAAEVARKCHCTPALIFIRLRALRALLGREPAELRQYSTHFQTIEESLSDPRARNIYRKGAIQGDDETEVE